MSNSELGTCAKITKAFLIIINILFVILGIILLAIGIWAIVNNQSYSYITGSSVVSGGALLIVCGSVTILINVLCIIGALFQLRVILLVFAAIISIIIILEIAAAVLTFVFGDRVEDQVRDQAREAISLYRSTPEAPDYREDVNDAVDTLQNVFDCCGYTNASDWSVNVGVLTANSGPPASCARCDVSSSNMDTCTTFTLMTSNTTYVSFNTTSEGCRDVSNTAFRAAAYTVGAIAIVFGIMEILGVLLAVGLCCCITSAKKDTVV